MVGDSPLNLRLEIQSTISTNSGCSAVWESYYQPVPSCSMIALWSCIAVISNMFLI